MGQGSWDGIKKRHDDFNPCPCKSVVELSATVSGELKLLKSDVGHVDEALQHHKEDITKFFTEFKLELKECMANITESSTKLRLGSERFTHIESDVESSKTDFKQHVVGKEGEHTLLKQKRKRDLYCLWGAITVVFITLASTGHADQLIITVKKILF